MSESIINGSSEGTGSELTAQITLANMALKLIPPGQSAPLILRDQIQTSLDELWTQHSGDYCAFSGLCQVVRPDLAPKTDFIDFAEGTSTGLYVVKAGKSGSEYWTTAFGFNTEATEGDQRVDYFLIAAAPHAIVPYETVDASFPENLQFPNLHNTLSRHSDELAANMNDHDFFELTAEQQKYYIDLCLEAARSELDQFGGISEKSVWLTAEYAYTIAASQGGNCYAPLNTETDLLKGVCKGLMVLERQAIDQDVSLLCPDDMVHIGSGMCLIVEPDAETAQSLGISKDSRLFVPISGQVIEVMVSDSSKQQI